MFFFHVEGPSHVKSPHGSQALMEAQKKVQEMEKERRGKLLSGIWLGDTTQALSGCLVDCHRC